MSIEVCCTCCHYVDTDYFCEDIEYENDKAYCADCRPDLFGGAA